MTYPDEYRHQLLLFDLALTQAIERCLDMNVPEALDAIIEEWPGQIATLLIEFLVTYSCGDCGYPNALIEVERDDGTGMYIGTLCGCTDGDDDHD